MLGKLQECFDGETIGTDSGCMSYCEFLSAITAEYGITGGMYANGNEHFWPLIEVLVGRAYEAYSVACSEPIDLLSIPLGMVTSCLGTIEPQDCVTLCGAQYTPYTMINCNPCTETNFTDEFLRGIVPTYRLTRVPSRQYYDPLSELLGWEFVFSESGIYVIVDDPSEFFAIQHLIPIPIGESITPVTIGC